MILVENGVAFNVTAEDFEALISDRAAGVVHPVDCYGFEVGACVGDVTDFGQAAATILRAAMAGDGPTMSGPLAIKLAQVEAVISEETMFFVGGAVAAA